MLTQTLKRLFNLPIYFPERRISRTLKPRLLLSKLNIHSEMDGNKEDISGLPLTEVLKELNRFADLNLAEKWDNVGLIVEPYSETQIKNILLTNDLTIDVMQESIEKKINLIISYHPPIFSALKRITNSTWKERIVAACLENRIAVFSPHTSWDAVCGGVNDWLADAFEEYIQDNGRKPIKEFESSQYIATLVACSTSLESVLKDLGSPQILRQSLSSGKEICQVLCTNDDITTLRSHKDILSGNLQLSQNESRQCGMGRLLDVSGLCVEDCVKLVKKQTKLPFVRLALAKGKTKDSSVQKIALCAGSGGSLLKGVKADIFVTGEMSHHEILDANHNDTSVILTNHSDSERGFLTRVAKMLQESFKNSINIVISSVDSDPLKTV